MRKLCCANLIEGHGGVQLIARHRLNVCYKIMKLYYELYSRTKLAAQIFQHTVITDVYILSETCSDYVRCPLHILVVEQMKLYCESSDTSKSKFPEFIQSSCEGSFLIEEHIHTLVSIG